MRNLRKAIRTILSASSICVASHENPDGDSIASIVAMGRALLKMGKKVFLLSPNGLPKSYSFLANGLNISSMPPEEVVDLLILLDAESESRLGKARGIKTNQILIIDHHPPSLNSPRVLRVTDIEASATTEVLWEVLKKLPVELDLQILEALLLGIVADTGGFRFPNTTPKALRVTAHLLERGARLDYLYQRLYENRTEGYLKLVGKVLLRTKRYCKGKIVLSFIFLKDLERYGLEDKELEGVVDNLRMLEGWETIVLLREMAKGTKASIRSRKLDANKFASLFGGGGHREAAGCVLPLPLRQARDILLEELKQWMEC